MKIFPLGIIAFALGAAGCTQQEAKTAIDVVDTACRDEAQDPAEPGWVMVTCDVIDSATGVIVGERRVKISTKVFAQALAAGTARKVTR